MAQETVTAKNKKINKEVAVSYDFGDTMDMSAKLFGDKSVHSGFVDSAKIALQSRLRDWLAKGKSAAECQQLAAQWKPGVGGVRVVGDPTERYKAFLNTMSPEEQLKTLEKLIAEKKAASAKK